MGPASTFSPINIWDLQFNADQHYRLILPDGHTSLLVVQKGKLVVGDQPIQAVELVLFERLGSWIEIESKTVSRVLVLTGEPLNEPVVGRGPFVMNSAEEINLAIDDYRTGRMGHLSH